MHNSKDLNINTRRVGVAGSSAGGNISAVLTHKYASDPATKDLPKLVFQLLVVPVCDNTADVESHVSWKQNEHVPQLPRGKMMWYRNLYLPNKSDWTNPEASPAFYSKESFSNVPPAFVALGECDVLRTEGEMYAAQIKQAGVPTTLRIYPGMPHPVMAMDDVLTQGKILVKETTDAVREALYA
jgi:acetyl esterase/lipase